MAVHVIVFNTEPTLKKASSVFDVPVWRKRQHQVMC